MAGADDFENAVVLSQCGDWFLHDLWAYAALGAEGSDPRRASLLAEDTHVIGSVFEYVGSVMMEIKDVSGMVMVKGASGVEDVVRSVEASDAVFLRKVVAS